MALTLLREHTKARESVTSLMDKIQKTEDRIAALREKSKDGDLKAIGELRDREAQVALFNGQIESARREVVEIEIRIHTAAKVTVQGTIADAAQPLLEAVIQSGVLSFLPYYSNRRHAERAAEETDMVAALRGFLRRTWPVTKDQAAARLEKQIEIISAIQSGGDVWSFEGALT